MKINSLAFAGIGPYKDEQHIDFEALEEDGIYLISGKTGAGKSTILDAICFALYSSVPRFDGAQTRLRSDYCAPEDPSFVTLEFSVRENRYRITRTPEYTRPAKRGGGLTTQKPTAVLEEWQGEQWVGLAARPVDVFPEIERIVGLSKDQFLQVILLAQNRFQEFLLAKNDERLQVLRSLFGTKRFGALEQHLADQRKTLAVEVEALNDAVRALAGRAAASIEQIVGDEPLEGAQKLAIPSALTQEWFAGLDAFVRQPLDTARSALSSAEEEVRRTEQLVTTATDLARRQRRRTAARQSLDTLGGQSSEVGEARRRLNADERANGLWSLVDGVETAGADALAAREAETHARAAVDEFLKAAAKPGDAEPPVDGPAASARAAALIEESTRTLGHIAEALADEARLDGLAAEIDEAETRLHAIDERVEDHRTVLETVPLRLADVRAHLDEARLTASKYDAEAARVKLLMQQSEAARALIAAEEFANKALRAEGDAVASHARAAAALSELFARRLNGDAAHLAAGLRVGEPCAVCGSIEHPQPAVGTEEAITDEMLENGRTVVSRAEELSKKAAAERRAADDAVADLRVASTGRDAASIDAELHEASDARDNARAAIETVAALDKEQQRLMSEQAHAVEAMEQLHLERAVISDNFAGVKSRMHEALKRVETHRGTFSSVRERADELQRAAESAQHFVRAAERARAASDALSQAQRALDRALGDSDFATVDELRAARLPRRERVELAERIRKHDDGVAAATATLAEEELRDLTDEPADVAAATEEADTAREAARALADVHAALRERQRALDGIVGEATQLLKKGGQKLAAHNVMHVLANTVEGKEPNEKRMHLEAYVLAAELEEIIRAANSRLQTMTSGRFRLEHDDARGYRGASSGLGLAIRDEYTGRARATASLSGGETFLASLALALGLAEVVTSRAGGITLETLFVDEGFGSLDRETLDITLSTLDSLRTGGRTVGLISHVDAMKEQIPSRLRITAGPSGASTVRQDAVVTELEPPTKRSARA